MAAEAAGPTNPISSRTITWLCVALLGAGALAHFWYVYADCPLDLTPDETFYWDWSRHPALSYDDQAPMTAWLIGVSRVLLAEWSMREVGSEALAVKIPAILLAFLTGLGIYVLALRTLRAPRVALGAVVLTFTVPIFVVGSMIMTIDAPLSCAWIWALVCVQRGLERGTLMPWLAAGVFIAFGVLSKFNMVLLFPAVGLTLLIEPAYRRFVARPGPYVATLVGLLGFVPILLWNAQNEWTHFRFVTRQSGATGASGFSLLGPLAMLAAQVAVIGPVWIVGLVLAVVALWRKPRVEPGEAHAPAAMRLLLVATLVPFVVFAGFSFLTKIQANWPVVGLLTGVIVLAAWLARLLRASDVALRRRAQVFLAAGVLVGVAANVVIHRAELLMPVFAWMSRGAPAWDLTPVARYDPSARMRGWAELGAAVGEVVAAERAAGRDPFIMTDTYQTAGELAFYVPGQPRVYSAQSVIGFRSSMYDHWENPIRNAERFIGRPCVYVGSPHPILTGESGLPAALPGLRRVRTVEHRVGGQLVQIWPILVSESFAGFPSRAPETRSR